MKDQFVTYEIAEKYRDKGFNEPCLAYFDENKTGPYGKPSITSGGYYDNTVYTETKGALIAAPLWQQAIDWLRLTHNINVEVNYLPNIEKYGIITAERSFTPKKHSKEENFKRGYKITSNFLKFDSYEQAREAAILKALELITK